MNGDAWTLVLLGAGLVSLPAAVCGEEKPNPVLTSLSSMTISGYVDTSAQWNVGTGDANTPAYAFGGTGKADGFNLNVVKLTLEKPVNSEQQWSAGYKADLLFGPDADVLATQSSGTAADFGVKQAYVALHAPVGNGLDFQMGVWDTMIGYEVTDSVNDPNYTRSYGYTIEPSTHTGIRAAYQFSETLAGIVGVADTFGPRINQRAFPPQAESYKTYLGSLTLTAPQSWGPWAGSTLSGCVINGYDSGANAGAGADQTSWYVGGTLNTPLKQLKVGASYDYAGVSTQPLSGSSYANAVALYASYQATEKLSLHARGEYASSDALTSAGTPLLGASRVFAVTGTVQYDLWKNVLSRIEFRWDHAADGSDAFGGTPVAGGTAPVPGTKKNSYILLADISYRF
jgi:Putative beta-barrel porin-2, OmpL-like. bbp2